MANHPTEGLTTSTGTVELHAEPSFLGVSAPGFVALSMLVVIGIILWARVPAMIGKALDARIDTIRRRLDEASALKTEAEALLALAKARTASSAGDAAAIIAQAETEAKAMLAKAEADASELVARRTKMAEDKIGAAERAAIADVRAVAAQAAATAAGAIIAERHGADADRALIDRTISGLSRAK